MKKTQILLFEDNTEDLELLTSILPDTFEIVGIANNLKKGLRLYKNLDIDIIIIDIFFQGEPLGIEFAHQVRILGNPKPVIFLANSINKDIFKKAKITNPCNYLIKPLHPSELLFAIELALEQCIQQKDYFDTHEPIFFENSIFVKRGQSLIKNNIDDIQYVEVEGYYCNIITDNDRYILQISLSKLMNELPYGRFLKTHRNCVVNTSKIKTIFPKDNLVMLTGGKKVVLSRRYKEALLKSCKIFR